MSVSIRFLVKKKCIWNSENNPWVEKYNKSKYYNSKNKILNILINWIVIEIKKTYLY